MEVSLEDDDSEFNETMKIPATRSDDCTPLPGINKDICKRLPDDFSYCKDVKDYDTYQNTVTHWWDASQLYGVNKKIIKRIRTKRDGKLIMTDENRLPIEPSTGLPITGEYCI